MTNDVRQVVDVLKHATEPARHINGAVIRPTIVQAIKMLESLERAEQVWPERAPVLLSARATPHDERSSTARLAAAYNLARAAPVMRLAMPYALMRGFSVASFRALKCIKKAEAERVRRGGA